MKPSLHSRQPNAQCVGRGMGGAWLGSRLARRGVRFGGMAIVSVHPAIAVPQSS